MKQITEQMKLELGPYDERMKLLLAMQESGLRPVVNRTKTVRRLAAPIGKTAADGVMKQTFLNLDPSDPKTNLSVYWDMLQGVDWHYEMAEGLSPAYVQGKAGFDKAASLSDTSVEHAALFKAYKAYVWDQDNNVAKPLRPAN
ncbi:MAG: hypothetical protein CL561_09940 [Alphaproteobacteria bacterium]|nr:hypothetical protein [Alphaproteobacteria bacterium]|tara:strand:+ start:185 stop:613 length:429 start_codon:yes stop_codon:yes gene_type:complete